MFAFGYTHELGLCLLSPCYFYGTFHFAPISLLPTDRLTDRLADRPTNLPTNSRKVRDRLSVVDATVELWLRRSAGVLARGGSEADTAVLQVLIEPYTVPNLPFPVFYLSFCVFSLCFLFLRFLSLFYPLSLYLSPPVLLPWSLFYFFSSSAKKA